MSERLNPSIQEEINSLNEKHPNLNIREAVDELLRQGYEILDVHEKEPDKVTIRYGTAEGQGKTIVLG